MFKRALISFALLFTLAPSAAYAPPTDACLDLKRTIVREESFKRAGRERQRIYVFTSPSGEAVIIPSDRVRFGGTQRLCREALYLPYERRAK